MIGSLPWFADDCEALLFAPIATLVLLAVLLVAFVSGRWRFDVLALIGLGMGVVLGLVPEHRAFSGFSHPAVVTVAAVLVLSRGLALSGATERIARRLLVGREGPAQIAALGGVGAVFSSVMNNVGALALLLPVAGASGLPPARILMPLAFTTILGGMITLIGTPPNLIVAAARDNIHGQPFGMFDFAPVGLAVALAGTAFIGLVGWRLVPNRGRSHAVEHDAFEMEDYLAEVRVHPGSEAAGRTVADLDPLIADLDVKIIGLIRNGRRIPAVPRLARVEANDILMIEALPRDLQPFVQKLGLELVDPGAPMTPLLQSADVGLVEAIVTPGSKLESRTALSARLQRQYGVNLLAVSRQGRPYRGRLRAFKFQAGDVLLLQGEADRLRDVVASLGCLPLAERGLRSPPRQQDRSLAALACFLGAIALAASGVLSVAVALAGGAMMMLALRILHMGQAYEAIEWPVIILLGALIPLGEALQASGATAIIADGLLSLTDGQEAWVVLALLMGVTTALTNVLNNAATAVVMAPLASQLARTLDANPDPFLMGVAVSASCAFLTPIGHQNNALVMGPGGYHFRDYWPLGLPLSVLVLTVGLLAILWVWPL